MARRGGQCFAVQAGFKGVASQSVEFSERWGQLLNLFIFFVFGVLAAQSWSQFNLPCLLYAVLSLTVVRMAPVAISLIGTRLCTATMLFMGWFGPRGLASIVLGLIVVEEAPQLADKALMSPVLVATVLLSVLVHGITAASLSEAFARKVNFLSANSPERG